MNLAKNIRDLRIKNNLTQKHFGAMFGVTRSSVSKWERGVCLPDKTILYKITTAYGLTIESLYGIDINNYVEDIKKTKENVNATIIKPKHPAFFVVPIFEIILSLLLTFSIVANVVSIFIDKIHQENNNQILKYENINCVLFRILNPNNEKILYTLSYKSTFNSKYYYTQITIDLPNNDANLVDLQYFATILIETRNNMTVDLPKINKLLLIENNNYLVYKMNNVYPCFSSSGTFDIIFYIEDGMGYLGAFLSE